MMIVVDESFGIRKSPFQHISFQVKPAKAGKKFETLRSLIESTKPGFFSKKVSIQPYTIEEEFAYFLNVAQEQESILYFFNASHTSVELLYRIRNWLLPERTLIPIPMEGSKGNKAEMIYLIYTLTEWYSRQTQYIGYQNFLIHSQYFKSQCISWNLTSEIRPFASDKKLHSVYKPLKKIEYKQVHIDANGRLHILKKGELRQLWQHVISGKTDQQSVLVVRKGIAEDFEGADYLVDIDSQTFPVNIPYAHVVFTPKIQVV